MLTNEGIACILPLYKMVCRGIADHPGCKRVSAHTRRRRFKGLNSNKNHVLVQLLQKLRHYLTSSLRQRRWLRGLYDRKLELVVGRHGG